MMVSKKASKSKHFLLLHDMSIFTCFLAVSHCSLCIYIEKSKKCEPQYKNNEKTKFLEAYNSGTKSHRHSFNIKNSYFDVLF